MMITSVKQIQAWNNPTDKRSIVLLLPVIVIMIIIPFQNAMAQEMEDQNKWSIGLQAGVLSGNLPTASATNTIVSRFNVENDFYLTAAFQAGYAISDFESLHLTLSRGEFSVYTDYEFWPDVLLKNQFYTANITTQLDLRRFIGSLPNRLDPFGSFGLGLMSSRHSVAPLNSQGTVQMDHVADPSRDLSFLFSTGVGLDYSLNSRMTVFFQFNHHFLSSDIIDKNFAGDVLQNDFIQTTNNWSTFTSGFRFKFGRSKAKSQTEPVRDDFQIVSTLNTDRINEMENEAANLSEQNSEDSSESESTANQTATIPVLPDSTVTTQSTEAMTEDETQRPQESTEPDIVQLTDDFLDDITLVTQPRFGLTGTAVEEIPGSYALNLHSFSTQDAAIEIIAQLNAEGFRVVTQTANVNGIDYFRVGVGQFETREDARSAAANLPEQYLNNYFIVQF